MEGFSVLFRAMGRNHVIAPDYREHVTESLAADWSVVHGEPSDWLTNTDEQIVTWTRKVHHGDPAVWCLLCQCYGGEGQWLRIRSRIEREVAFQ